VARETVSKVQAQMDEESKKKPDPSRAFNNMSDFQQMAAIISATIAGFLKPGEQNQVVAQMERIIDRDMEAQRLEFTQRMEALKEQKGMALNLFDLKRAELSELAIAKAMRWEASKRELDGQLAGSDSEIAKARGQQLLGKLNQEQAKLNIDLNNLVLQNGLSEREQKRKEVSTAAEIQISRGELALKRREFDLRKQEEDAKRMGVPSTAVWDPALGVEKGLFGYTAKGDEKSATELRDLLATTTGKSQLLDLMEEIGATRQLPTGEKRLKLDGLVSLYVQVDQDLGRLTKKDVEFMLSTVGGEDPARIFKWASDKDVKNRISQTRSFMVETVNIQLRSKVPGFTESKKIWAPAKVGGLGISETGGPTTGAPTFSGRLTVEPEFVAKDVAKRFGVPASAVTALSTGVRNAVEAQHILERSGARVSLERAGEILAAQRQALQAERAALPGRALAQRTEEPGASAEREAEEAERFSKILRVKEIISKSSLSGADLQAIGDIGQSIGLTRAEIMAEAQKIR
jgi:hypothetical protein